MFQRKEALYSMSDCSSSASSRWRGNDRGEVLHALTAQARKFTVSIFMSSVYSPDGQRILLYNCVMLKTDGFQEILASSVLDLALVLLLLPSFRARFVNIGK